MTALITLCNLVEGTELTLLKGKDVLLPVVLEQGWEDFRLLSGPETQPPESDANADGGEICSASVLM